MRKRIKIKSNAQIYKAFKKIALHQGKYKTTMSDILLATASLLVEPKASMACRKNWAAMLLCIEADPKILGDK